MTKNVTLSTGYLPFSVLRGIANNWPYHYEGGLVEVSGEDDGKPTPHHWTGSLLESRTLTGIIETPARVSCGGGDAACDDCGGNPPCGGNIPPSKQVKDPTRKSPTHIRIHADADMTNGSEISFTSHALHRIAILEPIQDNDHVRMALDAWRKARTNREVVYHVYRIEDAPSRPAMVGKLLAIPVPPEHAP